MWGRHSSNFEIVLPIYDTWLIAHSTRILHAIKFEEKNIKK